MAKWKSAPQQTATDSPPVPEPVAADPHPLDFLDAYATVEIAGVAVPVAAIVLPLGIFGLYQVFASVRRGNARRLRRARTKADPPAQDRDA